jgi:hypothetical protein
VHGKGRKGHRSEVCLVPVHTHSRIEDSRMMVNWSPSDAMLDGDGGMTSWGTGSGDGTQGAAQPTQNDVIYVLRSFPDT